MTFNLNYQNKAFNPRNTTYYITETVFPENKNAVVTIDINNNVTDNLHPENLNTRGHLLHLIDKQDQLYYNPEILEFISYLNSKGKRTAKVQGYQAVHTDTGKMIAGVHTDRFILNAIPVIGTDYFNKIAEAARNSETTAEIVKLYAALHEISHTIRNPKNMVYHILYRKHPYHAEKFVEKTVYKYAMKKAAEAATKEEKEKWLKIAEIAKDRHSKIKEIYKKSKKNIEEKVKDEEVEGKEDKESKYEKEYHEKDAEENTEKTEANPKDGENLESIVEGEVSDSGEACEASE